MENQRKIGEIALIVLLCIIGLSIIFSNNISFMSMLSFADSLNIFFLMLLYALIPLPVIILRVRFGFNAVRIIALAATVLAISCCIIHIVLPETTLAEHEWIFVFTQCILTSSVPVLYCIAFAGNAGKIGKGREIFVALTPSLLFFASLCIRTVMTGDLLDAAAFILSGSILTELLKCAGFILWALLFIFISRMIYKFINKPKISDAINNNKIRLAAFAGMILLVPLIVALIIRFMPFTPEPVFEFSIISDEYHGAYNFEVEQTGGHRLIINSKSRDIFGTVCITGDAFGETKTIYMTSGTEIAENLPMFMEMGIYTVTIDLTPDEWNDEFEITPARFNMIIRPLSAPKK